MGKSSGRQDNENGCKYCEELFIRNIKRLEREVSAYFDYIERLIEEESAFTMEQFIASVNEFLAFRKYKILTGYGKITKNEAEAKAEAEYNKFNKAQKIISDFDKTLKHLTEQN
jgi:hypothetical protein